MKLLKINDPLENKSHSADKSKEIVLGIDLGTTNSVVATFLNNKIEVLNIGGSFLIPSLVAILNNNIIVGKEVELLGENPKVTIFKSLKRFMARSKEDIINSFPQNLVNLETASNGVVKVLVKDESGGKFKSFSLIEISALILKYLKNEAEKLLNTSITKVVITVPAYFNEQARLATKQAAELANLKVLRLINEPTAAALAYGLDDKIEGTYLIYDLGGGTFDVSILKLNKGIFQVIATKGSLTLGGDDFDYLLALKIIKKIQDQNQIEINTHQYLPSVLSFAKEIKELLTKNNSVTKEIIINKTIFEVNFNLEELNEAILPLLNQTIDICKEALVDAKINSTELSGIILVGGSSKIPLVKDLLNSTFNIVPYCNLNPEKVVAIGAAYQAASLNGDIKKSLLLDITPLSLGIETYGGITEKIIFRNTPIPLSKGQEFTTFKDNQTSLKIHIVQGERELVKDNQSLAKFILKGIPPMPAGVPRILVTFTIDTDGLLTVTATEKNTKINQQIEVKPTFGLEIEDIKNRILDSINFVESDVKYRTLQLAKTEALHLVNITKSALTQDKSLISSTEVNKIEEILQKLIDIVNTDDISKIKEVTEELGKATQNFASKRINQAIKLSLEGKSINMFKQNTENT